MMGSEMSTPKDELPLAQLLARNKGRSLDPSRKIDEADGKAKDQTNLPKEENVAKSAPKNYAMARASQRVDDDKDDSDDSDGDGQDDDEEEESETESDEESEEEEQEDEDEEKDSKILSSTKAIMLGQSAFNDEDELPLAQILANKKSNLKQKSHATEGSEENDSDKEKREESSHDERKAKADVTNAESDDDNDDDEPLNDPDVVDASDTEDSIPIDQEDEDDESNDADDSLTDDSTTSNKRKRQSVRTSGRKKRKTNETDRGDGKPVRPRAGPRGPIDGRTCPHCNKVFSLNYGLRYHIDHYVCRPEMDPNPGKKKRGGRKKRVEGAEDATASQKRNNTKIRGSKEQRTCPVCQRVFTSALGLTYHVEHSVCEQKAAKPFPTLKPGSLFVTSFGVVQVVADDRAIPTATYPEDLKKLTRTWTGWKAKRDVQFNKIMAAAAVRQRTRRYQLAELPASNHNGSSTNTTNRTQQAVWKAYFGADPRKMPKSQWTTPDNLGPPREDPMFPKDSHPERIVECIQIPDERTKLLGLDEEAEGSTFASLKQTADQYNGKRTVRLFLQRKLLTEPYKPDMTVWSCPSCGQWFNSRPGIKFHLDGQVCKKVKAKVLAARESQQDIEKRARRPPVPKLPIKRIPKPKQKKKEDSMYPQVWLSLAFRLLPNKTTTQLVYAPQKVEVPREPEIAVEEPDIVLRGLRAQLQFVQKVQNVTLGPMYPEVFKSLKFKKPRQRKRKQRQQDGEEEEQNKIEAKDEGGYRPRRRRRTTAKPPPPPKPLPPIIDVRALADDVDCGRYPSVKRYKGDQHEEECYICKKGGTLYCCDFCNKAVHMDCMLEKFTIKIPEPEDDFMCHRCIQYVLQRRARAEKRRLRKQQLREAMSSRQGEIPEDMKGMEYEYVASQGREVSELIELIQDAQTRLRLALEAEKVNDIRRSFIESCENLDASGVATVRSTNPLVALPAPNEADHLSSEEL